MTCFYGDIFRRVNHSRGSTVFRFDFYVRFAIVFYKRCRVFVYGAFIRRRIFHVACRNGNFLIPALERIAILRRSRFFRGFARVCRHNAFFYRDRLQNRAVRVLKGYRVHGNFIYRIVGDIRFGARSLHQKICLVDRKRRRERFAVRREVQKLVVYRNRDRFINYLDRYAVQLIVEIILNTFARPTVSTEVGAYPNRSAKRNRQTCAHLRIRFFHLRFKESNVELLVYVLGRKVYVKRDFLCFREVDLFNRVHCRPFRVGNKLAVFIAPTLTAAVFFKYVFVRFFYNFAYFQIIHVRFRARRLQQQIRAVCRNIRREFIVRHAVYLNRKLAAFHNDLNCVYAVVIKVCQLVRNPSRSAETAAVEHGCAQRIIYAAACLLVRFRIRRSKEAYVELSIDIRSFFRRKIYVKRDLLIFRQIEKL